MGTPLFYFPAKVLDFFEKTKIVFVLYFLRHLFVSFCFAINLQKADAEVISSFLKISVKSFRLFKNIA